MKNTFCYCYKRIFLKYSVFISLYLVVNTYLFAQKAPRPEIDLDKFTQDLFGNPSGDARYDAVLESVFQYYRQSLDLNKATREELESLYLLSTIQINSFLAYRSENGRLLSEYELQAIPNFDAQTIEKILPFVKVEDAGLYKDNRPLWQRIANDDNNYAIVRYQRLFELQKGFRVNDTLPNQAFLGSPELVYGRYRSYQKGDYSVGITTQKDIGEAVAWNPARKQYGMDFYSGHLAVFNKGKIKALNIGDYQMMIGQGMVMAAGFYIGKGAEAVSTAKRSNSGLRPYTAAMETGFLRGAAATINFGSIDITPFYSYRLLDANIVNNEQNIRENQPSASSVLQTGFHRTQAELADKATLEEQVAGNYIEYRSKNKDLKIGINSIYTHYSPPIVPKENVYNRFYFKGTENFNYGTDISYLWKNFNFFAEYNRTLQSQSGLIAGFISSLSSFVDMALLFRNYDRGFYSSYGNAFGEASVNRNERGLYWGVKIMPNRKVNISGYFDKFYYPWLTLRSDAPTDGYEYMARINFKPTKKILLYGQWRHTSKPLNQAENLTAMDFLVESHLDNFLINLDWKAEKWISTKSRVQFTQFKQEGREIENGLVMFQDIDFDFYKKVKISARFAIFDANDYNTRIYVYEKNVLWAFAMPVYYGQGVRQYIMVQYNVNRDLSLWLRLAQFEYRNTDKISSGVNEIAGNTKTDITLQLKYDF